jgi:AcrR family transcriptional regulator
MKKIVRESIRSRKTPVQSRSNATVDAILEATIQVLTTAGAERLTTTLIAARAGVSVGTLYQYFPNKQSVLHAVLEKHLTKVVEALERERADASVALYAVSANPEANALMQRLRRRSLKALMGTLTTSPNASFEEVAETAEMLYAAMAGATRAVLEGGATPKMVRSLREQLTVLCSAYLAAAGSRVMAFG